MLGRSIPTTFHPRNRLNFAQKQKKNSLKLLKRKTSRSTAVIVVDVMTGNFSEKRMFLSLCVGFTTSWLGLGDFICTRPFVPISPPTTIIFNLALESKKTETNSWKNEKPKDDISRRSNPSLTASVRSRALVTIAATYQCNAMRLLKCHDRNARSGKGFLPRKSSKLCFPVFHSGIFLFGWARISNVFRRKCEDQGEDG